MSKEDIPIVIKTVLSTAQIERVSIFSLLLANKGKLTTSEIREYLKITEPTALRTMEELTVVGLVDEDEDMGVKRVTLRHEFDWFLSKEFAKLSEDFRPVDYNAFLKEKDDDQRKEKLPPHTLCENDDASKANSHVTNSLTSKFGHFCRIYDELEDELPNNPESTIDADKNKVRGGNLRQRLLDSNLFYQSDAAIIIQHMVNAGYLEEEVDTYRKKKQWLEEDFDGEDNSKKEK